MKYAPITVQHMDPATEEWTDLLHLHALKVNKTGGGEAYSSGREQYRLRLTFELRWCKELEALRYDTQSHRLIYQGHSFNITDYDDYMEYHKIIRLVGEAYG